MEYSLDLILTFENHNRSQVNILGMEIVVEIGCNGRCSCKSHDVGGPIPSDIFQQLELGRHLRCVATEMIVVSRDMRVVPSMRELMTVKSLRPVGYSIASDAAGTDRFSVVAMLKCWKHGDWETD